MARSTNTAVVLGSAQDGGVPQFGGPARFPPRTASSVAVEGSSGSRVLLDASPDLRGQHATLVEALGPAERDGRPFDAILLTHAHMGHYTGLVHFGREALAADGVPCHATAAMLGFLSANQPWAALFAAGHLVAAEVVPGRAVDLGPDVKAVAHPVRHRPDFSDTVGYEVRFSSGRSLLYLPDIDAWSGWPQALEVLGRVDVALIDATFYSSDEHPSRDLSRVPHPPVATSVDFLRDVVAETRVILTHLNWTNPVCDPGSAEAAAVAAAGFEVAWDGMTIEL